MFLRAPPRKPATWAQHQQRHVFRHTAAYWQDLTPANRAHWNTLTRRANLRITAYNLFVHVTTRAQDATLATLLHQTGITDTQLYDPDSP